MFMTHQVWGEQDCYQEKELVLNKCRKTLKVGKPYVEPSEPCIHAVRHSDMTCVCRHLTVDEENKVSAAKLVLLAKECGNPVPAGNKCGSKCIKISISFLHKSFVAHK